MGKSMACLNIIACGKKDGVDRADLEAPENKISSDRHGWSFRKRTTWNRVLNNTASSETPSSANKLSPESDAVGFQAKPELYVQENTSPVQRSEDKTDHLPSQGDTKLSSDAQKKDNVDEADMTFDECVITIQASVRGFLARKLLSTQKKNISVKEENVLIQSDAYGDSIDLMSGKNISVKGPEKDDELISYEAIDSRCVEPTPNPIEIEDRDLTSKVVIESAFAEGKEADTELSMRDSETSSIEQPDETEAKKLFSRKASNPAFIAAQQKFEELSSGAKILTTSSSFGNESGVKSGLDKVSSSYTDLQINGSECGTELSISSTLDSPDRSESLASDNELKPKDSGETIPCISKEHSEIEANGNKDHARTEADASYPNSDNKSDKYEMIKSSADESGKDKPETDRIESHNEVESDISHAACNNNNKSSPESVSESEATPSSQISVKPKKNGVEKRKSNSSSFGDKKEISNRHVDSTSSKNGPERDNKTGKRRNSFESIKSDHKEQEPRDSSSSSNSLPSYMQATKSARAKAISRGSPRSSSDVLEKDVYDVRKRQSLPSSHERQGSPRIQRSLSQARQNVKGNETQSPQDRKWRR